MGCEISILIVLGGELYHAALNGRGNDVFGGLVALYHPPCVKIEELVASPGVNGGPKEDAMSVTGDVGGVQWVMVIVHPERMPQM